MRNLAHYLNRTNLRRAFQTLDGSKALSHELKDVTSEPGAERNHTTKSRMRKSRKSGSVRSASQKPVFS
jgi:hypothetical protein